MYCTKCGGFIPDGADKCPACNAVSKKPVQTQTTGNSQGVTDEQPTSPVAENGKKPSGNMTTIIAIIVFVCVMLVAIFGVVAISRNKESQTEANAETFTEEQQEESSAEVTVIKPTEQKNEEKPSAYKNISFSIEQKHVGEGSDAIGSVKCYADGKEIWEIKKGPYPITELERKSDEVLVDGDYAYFVLDEETYKIEKYTGKVIWRDGDCGAANSIVLYDKYVFVSGYYGPNLKVMTKDGTVISVDGNEQLKNIFHVYELEAKNGKLYVSCENNYAEEATIEIDIDALVNNRPASTPTTNRNAQARFTNANASSTLESSQYGNYIASNVLDNNKATAWVEGVDGDGIGEYVTLFADVNAPVNGIKILNGYNKNADIFAKNNRAARVRITLSTGDIYETQLVDNYNTYTFVDFGGPKAIEGMKIEILSVYPGSKYQDTCISEIIAY